MAEGSNASAKWSDLGVRVISAGVIMLLALGALFGGPLVWSIFVLLIYVLMLRELAKLCEPEITTLRRWSVALIPVAVLVIAVLLQPAGDVHPEDIWNIYQLGPLRAGLVVMIPILFGLIVLRRGHGLWLGYGTLLACAALALDFGHVAVGPRGILALVAIVVISDVAGYFAGRALGGPKFWPRISPKKTWSGTIAGWVGAAIFGALVGPSVWPVTAGVAAIAAVLLSFAGQMGDILESWMKRRAGVKDSSTLIPGHGGVLDRLDALVAVAALSGIAAFVAGVF